MEKTTTKYSCIFSLLCFSALLGLQAGPAAEKSTVRIIVSDTYGLPLKDASVVLKSVGPHQTFMAKGGEAKFEEIPFGVYDVDIQLAGFPERQERIRVYQSSLVFHIGLRVPTSDGDERSVLLGTISDSKNLSDLWVRLIQLYSSDLVENSVGVHGEFELAGVAPGPGIILIFQKEKLLSSIPITVKGGSQQLTLSLQSASQQQGK